MSDPIYRKDVLRLAADATGAGTLSDTPRGADGRATAHNPACGDKVTMEVAMADGRIIEIRHQTQACILAQASAAILGAVAVGKDAAELAALEASVRGMLEGGDAPPGAPFDSYRAFDGVGEIRGRHTCVLLPIRALRDALDDAEKT